MSDNQLDSNGLQIKTNADIIASLTTAFQSIYGSDINLNSNSPDGQIVNIQAQAITDLLELLVSVYNSFDPDSAFGAVLDQRCAINGIVRQAGTFTLTPINITVDRAVNLPGLDSEINNPDGTGFTVSDGAGNNYILASSVSIGGASTATLSFRAQNIGAIEPQLNTITNQVTVTLGVTAVNNPNTYSYLGVNEETDTQLKVRRLLMFYLAGVGPADAVRAAILQIPGVTDVYVGENVTGSPSGGIDAHSIWVIVDGGDEQTIGETIYEKKSAGCGMTQGVTGDVTVTVNRPQGDTIAILFNRPIEVDLYIQLTITPKVAGTTFDNDAIKTALVAALTYKMNQTATIDEIVTAMSTIEPDAYVTALGVSDDDITYVDLLAAPDIQSKYVLDVARITIT